MDERPSLSLIVVVGRLRDRAVECLASALHQEAASRMEVLLMDCAGDGFAPLDGSDHEAVRTIRLPPATPFSTARLEGVIAARAPVVAFLEEHCRLEPGWADAMIRAHDQPWAGVGGAVINANPGVGSSDVIGIMSYGLWYAPARRGEVDLIPGQNSSYKRDLLLGLGGGDLRRLLQCDVVLQLKLRADGHRLLLEPAARFRHLNETGFRTIARGYFLFHRFYGVARAEVLGWSWARRLFYVAATPAIPLYYLARYGQLLRRAQPRLVRPFLLGAPLVLAAQLAAAVGQAVGLLVGPGSSEARFTDYELHAPRPTVTHEIGR